MNKASQIYFVFIRTTPEKLWDAISNPEFTVKYFHGSAVETKLEPGGPYHFHAPDRSKLWGDGKVVESDPPRKLVYTWHALWTDEIAAEKASRVTWLIEPQKGGFCKLTVTHDQLEGAPMTADHVGGAGWMFVLSGLKTLIETGEPMGAMVE